MELFIVSLAFIIGFIAGAYWLTDHTIDEIKQKSVIRFGGKYYKTTEVQARFE
jgi:hypothetical protein